MVETVVHSLGIVDVAGSEPQRFIRVIAERLTRAVLVAWGVSLVAFALVRIIPGDPVLILLGDNATAEGIARLRAALHLEGSILEQYAAFAGDLLRGDLGRSLSTGQAVTTTILNTLPVTAFLIALTMLEAVAMAVPIGLIWAAARSRPLQEIFRLVSSMVLAIPVFLSGLVLLLVFAVHWPVLPVAGYEPRFPDNIRHLALPSFAAALPLAMIFARMIQTAVRDTLAEDFVETAIVWGLPKRTLIWSYLIRPSVAPVIALMGYVIGASLASVVVLETVFSLPGVGSYLVQGVLTRDYPVVQGTLVVFGLIVVLVHFAADSISGWIDPRASTI